MKDGHVFPKGEASQPLDLAVPENAGAEMVIATRPNAIRLTKNEGYITHIEKRIVLTDRTEYLVPVGEQLVKIQTPYRVVFAPGEQCGVVISSPGWYPPDDKAAEAERAKRQIF